MRSESEIKQMIRDLEDEIMEIERMIAADFRELEPKLAVYLAIRKALLYALGHEVELVKFKLK